MTNKIPDELFLYCKAFDKRNYYCGVYDIDSNELTSLVGSGDFESVIDATYQAIISGLKIALSFGAYKRIRVANDIQFVVNQLSYSEPLVADYLVSKYSDIQIVIKSFSHIRWIWINRDELIKYVPFF